MSVCLDSLSCCCAFNANVILLIQQRCMLHWEVVVFVGVKRLQTCFVCLFLFFLLHTLFNRCLICTYLSFQSLKYKGDNQDHFFHTHMQSNLCVDTLIHLSFFLNLMQLQRTQIWNQKFKSVNAGRTRNIPLVLCNPFLVCLCRLAQLNMCLSVQEQAVFLEFNSFKCFRFLSRGAPFLYVQYIHLSCLLTYHIQLLFGSKMT